MLAMVYGVLVVVVAYRREMHIADKINAIGGVAVSHYGGPEWIPESVRGRLPFLKRLVRVDLSKKEASSDLLTELGLLSNLCDLSMDHSQVGDEGIASLKQLRILKTLYLTEAQITDEGLVSRP